MNTNRLRPAGGLVAAFCVAMTLQFCGVLLAGDEPKTQPSSDTQEVVYSVGPGITPPRLIKQVQPTFSGVNFQRNGVVLVSLVVNVDGVPQKVSVTRGLDAQTDRSAIEAVQAWRFTPGRKGTEPVPVKLTVELRFHDV